MVVFASVAISAGWTINASGTVVYLFQNGIIQSRIPHIAAGMPPFEYADETQQAAMDDAINATLVTMVGDQPLNLL
jgi:hypothetical protein